MQIVSDISKMCAVKRMQWLQISVYVSWYGGRLLLYWADCKPEGPLFSAEFVCLSVCLWPQGWARDVSGRDRDETETRRLQVSRRDRDVEVYVYCH